MQQLEVTNWKNLEYYVSLKMHSACQSESIQMDSFCTNNAKVADLRVNEDVWFGWAPWACFFVVFL